MSDLLLALTRLLLLALLYLFLWRVVRVVAADLRGPRPAPAAPRAARPAAPATTPPSDRARPRQLVVHQPGGTITTVDLATVPVRLGRAPDATVVVDDEYVSDEHTEFLPGTDGWSVRDLGSTNGTQLNGSPVRSTTRVSAGDQVRIGRTRVEVRR